MTQALSVRCQNCGSPLQVNEGIRFVTCGYCSTELQIVRDASTVHSEILQKLDRRTSEMSGSLKNIEVQNEIERLDREWQMWREGNLPRGKSGRTIEPGNVAFGVMGAFALAFAVVWLIIASYISSHFPAPISFIFPCFGLFFIAMVVYNMVRGMSGTSAYHEARQSYEARREALLKRLAEPQTAPGEQATA